MTDWIACDIWYCVSYGNSYSFLFFFFNETATTEIYTVRNTLSLHDALADLLERAGLLEQREQLGLVHHRREEIGRAHVCTPVTSYHLVCRLLLEKKTNIA